MTDSVNTIAQIVLILCGFIVAICEIFSDEFKKGQFGHNVLRGAKILIGFVIAALGVVTWYCGNVLDKEKSTQLTAAQQTVSTQGVALQKAQGEIHRLQQAISRFEVGIRVKLSGDWKSAPPTMSGCVKTWSRDPDARVEIQARDADARWIEFYDASPPLIAQCEGNTWTLDYTAKAPDGSWIMNMNRDDLRGCGKCDFLLYGITRDTVQDGGVVVTSASFTFYINGVAVYRAEYSKPYHCTLKDNAPLIGIILNGPVPMERIN
jgi:hypothetical protein